jgi:hypothetical protein
MDKNQEQPRNTMMQIVQGFKLSMNDMIKLLSREP